MYFIRTFWNYRTDDSEISKVLRTNNQSNHGSFSSFCLKCMFHDIENVRNWQLCKKIKSDERQWSFRNFEWSCQVKRMWWKLKNKSFISQHTNNKKVCTCDGLITDLLFILNFEDVFGNEKVNQGTHALSFYRSQNVLGWSKFLWQTKNLFTYCGSHKHFVPVKKMICTQ